VICNIVDHRRGSKYQWAKVWGVVEPTWHDNSVAGRTWAPREDAAPSCEEAGPMTLADLLEWAMAFPHTMTLFVYDEDPMRLIEDRKRPGAVEHRPEAAFGPPFTVYSDTGPIVPKEPA
jgi:hypothetical protein